jgi:serine/threonine-protein kinase
MQSSPPSIPPGTLLAGKLRIVRLLGVGGMGAVYEVEHEFTKHRRALKLLHGEMAANAMVVTRFLREASAAGRIGNPHIVETYDAGRLDSGEPYIVMELLKGSALAKLLEERGQLGIAEAVEILKQACAALQAAHESGIVHRDIKPDNMFLLEGPRIFVKILDFGISKFDASQTGGLYLTNEGTALGTPYYMPPEQVRGATDLGPPADVYALGVVLYECLTGHRPFEAETLPHLAVMIHEGNYTPLRTLRPDASRELEAIVGRAMSVHPEQRFPSASALRDALANLELVTAMTALSPGPATNAISYPPAEPRPQTAAGALSMPPPGERTAGSGTSSTRSSETSPARGKGRGLLVLGAVAILAAASALVFRAVRSDGPGHAAMTPTSEQSAPAEPPMPSDLTGAPEVTPLLHDGALPSASTAPSAAPHARASASALRAPPRTTPTAGTPHVRQPATRASEHGLIQENPF